MRNAELLINNRLDQRSTRWPQWLAAATGAAAGVLAWVLWTAAIPLAPIPVRFVVAFGVFVLGPGLAAAGVLVPHGQTIERWVIALAAGLVLSPAIAQLLGELGLVRLYASGMAALGGMALGWRILARRPPVSAIDWRDVAACGLVGTLAIGGGVAAYAHRMSSTPKGLVFYGDYDTFDSTYYAAISAELAHQIPPDAPFRAGHRLGYAYHPQLLAAMVHRFGGVPLLDLYLRYLWPAFLLITALTIFVTVRRLSSPGVALLAAGLVLFGSDLSYIAAELRPRHADFDRIIWSNNWLTPGAEQLFFNTWTPALAVLFLGFWMFDRHEDDGRARWVVGAAACFASLMQFKPFGFAPIMAGLIAVAAFAGADRRTRRLCGLVFAASLVLALPYLLGVSHVYQESQAVLRRGIGYADVLPQRVITQIGLDRPLAQITAALGGGAVTSALVSVTVANVLFVVGGIGTRLAGLPAVWRSLKGDERRSVWRLMAWTIVAGAAFPLVVVTEPNHQTFHTFHASLFLLWIFTARVALQGIPGAPWRTIVVAAAIVLLSVPSTVHYLRLKWTDLEFGAIHRDMFVIADYLREEDHARTVLLHRYPQGPSFVALLAERRTVLAWAGYARGTVPLQEEIDWFFRSADGDPASAWSTLGRHDVTHVIETVGRDRIHAAVVSRLRLLLATETLRLYAVPGGEVATRTAGLRWGRASPP